MTFPPITPLAPTVPMLMWALIIDSGRVIEVAHSATEPDARELGQWQDATGANPAPRVGMVYTDGGAYKLPRWAQIIGNTVANVTEQISPPGSDWVDCTGMHIGPGWRHDGEVFAAPAAAPRRITVLEFRNRFSMAEKVSIEIAALDDPTAPMPQRAQSAALRANQLDVQAAGHIDLDRPDTRAGVQSLEVAGLLAPGRATEILDGPISPQETFSR